MGGAVMRFFAWLIRKGWYWSRCKGCGRFSNHHSSARYGKVVVPVCTRCDEETRDYWHIQGEMNKAEKALFNKEVRRLRG
jgi:hypothetical protein